MKTMGKIQNTKIKNMPPVLSNSQGIKRKICEDINCARERVILQQPTLQQSICAIENDLHN